MSNSFDQKSAWVYEGIWGVLTSIFCVPRDAPALPIQDGEKVLSHKPAPNYLRYLKFQLRLGLAVVAVPLIGGSIILAFAENEWFLVATVVLVSLIGAIGVFAILAIHLRYDTMWYVFSDRSMRLRRGIWVIRESTITFENIQNVKVMQGPLQRWFGIADVIVETAGGGGRQGEPGGGLGMHSGVIEGVADATNIRDSIMSRVGTVKTTGLGDESQIHLQTGRNWTASHVGLLREIRDLLKEPQSQPRD